MNSKYDTGVKAAPNSPLETAYMIVFQKRQMAQRIGTQLQVMASLASGGSKDGAKTLGLLLDDYATALFPYSKQQEAQRKEQEFAALKKWSSGGPVHVTPLIDVTKRKHDVRRVEMAKPAADQPKPGQIGTNVPLDYSYKRRLP